MLNMFPCSCFHVLCVYIGEKVDCCLSQYFPDSGILFMKTGTLLSYFVVRKKKHECQTEFIPLSENKMV